MIKVIRLNESHAPCLAEIERKCFSAPWSEDTLRQALNNPGYVFFGVADDDICAYASASIAADECYIANIAVLPEYRRKGYARLLVDKLIEHAKKLQMAFISLEVRASNNAAISLYESSGFEQAGLRKDFYSNPAEDAVIMTKKLK